jgi:hypothetical protein
MRTILASRSINKIPGTVPGNLVLHQGPNVPVWCPPTLPPAYHTHLLPLHLGKGGRGDKLLRPPSPLPENPGP